MNIPPKYEDVVAQLDATERELAESRELLFQWLAMLDGGISYSMLGVLREGTRQALSSTKEDNGDE